MHLQQRLDVRLALVLEYSPPQEPLLPVQVRLLVVDSGSDGDAPAPTQLPHAISAVNHPYSRHTRPRSSSSMRRHR